MAESRPYRIPPGPFLADQIREGDPYELSEGHAIRCLPTGARGSAAAATGSAVLKSNPLVESSGVETGFTASPDSLRAPDVAVGNVPDAPGWVKGVPPLAVEYADQGQDEADLAAKIREFLAAGTRFIWVVRLAGPRRVEVHEPGRELRVAGPGEELRAPGVLRNPVPVEALYDWGVGQQVTLRNLLQRQGYQDLDAVLERGRELGFERGRAQGLEQGREQGFERGREQGLEQGLERGREQGLEQGLERGREQGGVVALRDSILTVAEARGVGSSALREAVLGCDEVDALQTWLRRVATAAVGDEIVDRRPS